MKRSEIARAHMQADSFIAREIHPKRRGWAWEDRNVPVELSEPPHYHQLVLWAKRQDWWHRLAVPPWSTIPGHTWAHVFEHFNRHLFDEQLRFVVRDMIKAAIVESRKAPATSGHEFKLVMPQP